MKLVFGIMLFLVSFTSFADCERQASKIARKEFDQYNGSNRLDVKEIVCDLRIDKYQCYVSGYTRYSRYPVTCSVVLSTSCKDEYVYCGSH